MEANRSDVDLGDVGCSEQQVICQHVVSGCVLVESRVLVVRHRQRGEVSLGPPDRLAANCGGTVQGSATRAVISEKVKGLVTARDSDAALNAAWARRAGMQSYLPRSGRAGVCCVRCKDCRAQVLAQHPLQGAWLARAEKAVSRIRPCTNVNVGRAEKAVCVSGWPRTSSSSAVSLACFSASSTAALAFSRACSSAATRVSSSATTLRAAWFAAAASVPLAAASLFGMSAGQTCTDSMRKFLHTTTARAAAGKKTDAHTALRGSGGPVDRATCSCSELS